jgi:uncharacterized membrane protein YbhN (UPF0104 family)
MRWREMFRYRQAPPHLAQAFRFNMIGTFFNQTLPSTIGVNAVRLWLVTRTGASWRFATYSALVDWEIGLIALAIVVVVSLPWNFELIRNDHRRATLVLLDVAAMSARRVFRVNGRLRWRWLEIWWPIRHVHARSVIANLVIFNCSTANFNCRLGQARSDRECLARPRRPQSNRQHYGFVAIRRDIFSVGAIGGLVWILSSCYAAGGR